MFSLNQVYSKDVKVTLLSVFLTSPKFQTVLMFSFMTCILNINLLTKTPLPVTNQHKNTIKLVDLYSATWLDISDSTTFRLLEGDYSERNKGGRRFLFPKMGNSELKMVEAYFSYLVTYAQHYFVTFSEPYDVYRRVLTLFTPVIYMHMHEISNFKFNFS